MECSEDGRLRMIYEAALRAWNINSRILGGPPLSQNTYRHRKDLLHARLRAAKELYDHSVSCPNCKAARLASMQFRDSW